MGKAGHFYIMPLQTPSLKFMFSVLNKTVDFEDGFGPDRASTRRTRFQRDSFVKNRREAVYGRHSPVHHNGCPVNEPGTVAR